MTVVRIEERLQKLAEIDNEIERWSLEPEPPFSVMMGSRPDRFLWDHLTVRPGLLRWGVVPGIAYIHTPELRYHQPPDYYMAAVQVSVDDGPWRSIAGASASPFPMVVLPSTGSFQYRVVMRYWPHPWPPGPKRKYGVLLESPRIDVRPNDLLLLRATQLASGRSFPFTWKVNEVWLSSLPGIEPYIERMVAREWPTESTDRFLVLRPGPA